MCCQEIHCGQLWAGIITNDSIGLIEEYAALTTSVATGSLPSTGRKCEYAQAVAGTFSSASPLSSTALDNPLANAPNTVWGERRAFAYYHERVALFVGGDLDVDFWGTFVPQLCQGEPAVWDAIIAISALFETYEHPASPVSVQLIDQPHGDALAWYSRSVTAIRQRIARGQVDIFVGLITCVLFICVETLQGREKAALQLFSQGLQLVQALRVQIASGMVPASKAVVLENAIVPIFVRLGVLAFSDTAPRMDSLLEAAAHVPSVEFPSLRCAREALTILGAEALLFERQCLDQLSQSDRFHVTPELINMQARFWDRLDRWETGFKKHLDALHQKNPLTQHQMVKSALLIAYHKTTLILVTICVSSLQTMADHCLEGFQVIVDQCRLALDTSRRPDGTQPPFTFDLGVGLPLWFTSLRCREPHLRRAAVELLRRAPPVMGFYRSTAAVSFAENIIMLEEGNAMALRPTIGYDVSIAQAWDCSSADSMHGEIVAAENTHTLSAVLSRHDARLGLTDIPEEARIGPIHPVRQDDDSPPNTMQDEVMDPASRNEVTGMRFTRNKRDWVRDTWQRVHEYLPL
ncbi:C6 zinc finger domain protein [Aspergillus saccharolyticus JOP 1030-1]|uniref:C6 zinc finger domain protein n=1 Tax=Aspergillus saccharolyticus JOP 1030-1 TaxID=1450539 RepID=A0A318Z5U7_9EURO|nr:C6 zinc finger domain protein [Aspergillus saccharolyticus JOP 1030-1]PYH40113.1 C6 zinc finger domain protein [Aspergillus saccharolyticus JOP 1030-1]